MSRFARGLFAASTLARASLALFLILGSIRFGLHGRMAFSRLGYPDWVRLAVAGSELAAAILFAIPSTVLLGGVALVAILGWAAGFHFALGQSTAWLFADLSAVAALLWVENARKRRWMKDGSWARPK